MNSEEHTRKNISVFKGAFMSNVNRILVGYQIRTLFLAMKFKVGLLFLLPLEYQ